MTDLDSQHGPAAQIATGIGHLLAQAATAAGDRSTADAEETTAITDAMIRLLAGVPLRSDGKLTIKSLAAEAGLLRNKLTHKHTGLKDLFDEWRMRVTGYVMTHPYPAWTAAHGATRDVTGLTPVQPDTHC